MLQNWLFSTLLIVVFAVAIAWVGSEVCRLLDKLAALSNLSRFRSRAPRTLSIRPLSEQRLNFQTDKAPVYHIITTDCHPEANGRQPDPGDQGWKFNATLDDGAILELRMGRKGRDALLAMLMWENADDMEAMMGRSRPPHHPCPG